MADTHDNQHAPSDHQVEDTPPAVQHICHARLIRIGAEQLPVEHAGAADRRQADAFFGGTHHAISRCHAGGKLQRGKASLIADLIGHDLVERNARGSFAFEVILPAAMTVLRAVVEPGENGEVSSQILQRAGYPGQFVIRAGLLRKKARRVKTKIAADSDEPFHRRRARCGSGGQVARWPADSSNGRASPTLDDLRKFRRFIEFQFGLFIELCHDGAACFNKFAAGKKIACPAFASQAAHVGASISARGYPVPSRRVQGTLNPRMLFGLSCLAVLREVSPGFQAIPRASNSPPDTQCHEFASLLSAIRLGGSSTSVMPLL